MITLTNEELEEIVNHETKRVDKIARQECASICNNIAMNIRSSDDIAEGAFKCETAILSTID